MKEQDLQESEYEFPYHHIPQFGTESFSETRHLFWGYEYASYLEYILELLSENSFDSLIDVGCGDGRLLLEVEKAFPGKRLVGTDFSKRAIAFAKAFAPQLDFRAGTIEETMGGETFSCATLIEVLEHIPLGEADHFLETFNALIAPGGMGVISVPSTNIPLNPKHFRHFDAESLRKTLEHHFEIVSIEYLNAHTLGEKILRRLLANRLFILNEPRLIQGLYRFYKKHYLHTTHRSGERVIAIVSKR